MTNPPLGPLLYLSACKLPPTKQLHVFKTHYWVTHYFFSFQIARFSPPGTAPWPCFLFLDSHSRREPLQITAHRATPTYCILRSRQLIAYAYLIYPSLLQIRQSALNGNSQPQRIFLDHVILMCYYHHLWFHLTSLLLYSVPPSWRGFGTHVDTHTDRLGTAAVGQYWLLWKTLWHASRAISSVHGSSPCVCSSAWKASL